MSKAIVVTGSRNWDAGWVIEHVLAQLDEGDIVIVGDCPTGADMITRKEARELGLTLVVERAHWSKRGKRAGPERNARMANMLGELRLRGYDCRCEAFPLAVSVGTRGCMALVRAQGIEVREWTERGEVRA